MINILSSPFLRFIIWVMLLINVWVFKSSAEEVLQREKLTFSKCVEVINTTAETINVKPEFRIDTEVLKIAEFKMSDGILVLNCDANEEVLLVSSR